MRTRAEGSKILMSFMDGPKGETKRGTERNNTWSGGLFKGPPRRTGYSAFRPVMSRAARRPATLPAVSLLGLGKWDLESQLSSVVLTAKPQKRQAYSSGQHIWRFLPAAKPTGLGETDFLLSGLCLMVDLNLLTMNDFFSSLL